MGSLGNSILWGDLVPGGTGGELFAGGLDSTQVIDELLPSLHADSRADLVFWTEGDLIQWMDEALKRLARIACVFVGRQASAQTVAGTAAYALPVQHIATLHVSYGATPLRPANQMELEARDPAYLTTPGTPDHWYEDLVGMGTVGFSPVPDQAMFYPVIYAGWPDALDTGKQQTLVAGPAPLKGYIAMCVLQAAYSREGELESADIAAHCKSRMDLYEQAMTSYYGKAL